MSRRIMLLLTLFALFVMALGAYTRLKDAGLGCPDWPGCYGQWIVPQNLEAHMLSDTPLDPEKAWIEMIHRYVAGTLGLCLFAGTVRAYRQRIRHRHLWLLLSLLVVAQAALGMWTVTLKLLPGVVMMHLLGGMTITTLCFWLYLRTPQSNQLPWAPPSLRPWVITALWLVGLQMALGAWVSTNYAALACPDFPSCGVPLEWSLHAFTPWQGWDLDQPLSALSAGERAALQMTHRFGALLVACVVGFVAFSLIRTQRARRCGWVILFVLSAQIALGITNVLYWLPLPAAVAHHSMAMLLWLSLWLAEHGTQTHQGMRHVA